MTARPVVSICKKSNVPNRSVTN